MQISIRGLAMAAVCTTIHGCAWGPPEAPNLAPGCLAIETTIPSSFSDTLGYELPSRIGLLPIGSAIPMVLPTDEEWAPVWTNYRATPTDWPERRSLILAGDDDPASYRRIPGDSIDIVFPGPIGSLVLRIGGEDRGRLGGRAAYSTGNAREVNLLADAEVRVERTSCDGLPLALARTRYR